MQTQTYYAANKQYGNRPFTDAQIALPWETARYAGVMDAHARFVEENQLLFEDDWHLFVNQFRTHSDDADTGWRGEYFGKMMRGAAWTYQYTKNEKLYALLEKIAVEMLETQDAAGRFSTYGIPAEFSGWDLWSRKYVLLGFLHFHEICRDAALRQKIETALEKHLDYIVDHIYEKKVKLNATTAHWGGINSASILEPTVRMYNLTGKKSYLDFAEYIIAFLTSGKANIFSLALENKLLPYQYPIVKAYEMMSCFEGLIEYYRATGKEWCRTAVINFVEAVAKSDVSVIGCAGCKHELFNHAAATQTDPDYKGVMQETCVTVTWMKLCNQLLMLTGEAKYADRIERSVYNALHGAVNTEKREKNGGYMFDSYSPLLLGERGRLVGGYRDISETRHYGCCVAIGAAGTALPLLTAVTATQSGIAVNYYEKGTVTANGFSLDIDTRYPAAGEVKITVTRADAGEREIALRIPAFAGEGTRLTVNGEERKTVRNGASFYAKIARAWQAGDRIELTLDMHCRVALPEGMDEKPESKNHLAVLYGPLVLARDARYTAVGTPVNAAETAEITPLPAGGARALLFADVRVGGETLRMVDYGSAGKTWDEKSLTEVWLKTNQTQTN